MLLTNATRVGGDTVDVRIEDETIADVDSDLTADPDERVMDADGRLVLPGAIDAHVHFREPGYSHKETWKTGTQSAAAGGVTTVVDMPNTTPPTTTGAFFDAKAACAEHAVVDYGLNGGVTGDWEPESLFSRPLCALGEVFLADSTGEMGIDTDRYREAVRRASDAEVPITVHAEDATVFDESATNRTDADAWSAYRTAEAEVRAIEHACAVADDLGAAVHIAHTSTPEGADVASDMEMTCEVTPHHLFLSRDDLEGLGTLGRMNPPLRSERRREAMFRRLVDGRIDIVATDHAPHTLEEKDADIWNAPSGVPGVETALPLLLEAARNGQIGYERVRDVTAANVAEIFGLERKGRIEAGAHADLVLVDPDDSVPIHGEALHSKCGWTPFEGRRGVFPELTMVRGTVAFRDGSFADASGENVRA